MNNVIEQLIRNYNPRNSEEVKNAIREITQSIVLIGLSRSNFFSKASFYGGTALRIFYGLNRYSEDLDFTLNILATIIPFKFLAVVFGSILNSCINSF